MSTLMGRTHLRPSPRSESSGQALLVRAGYIRQHAAGIYSYLHLGLRSLRKLERIVRDAMDRTGAQEILMPVVQSAAVWKQTGRYDEIDATLTRFTDRSAHDMVLGMTHEEVVGQLAASELQSYRDAGIIVYQIQTKYRDEPRPRGGLLRTREFLMKDAYSLHLERGELEAVYGVLADSYRRIFRRAGLRNVYMIRSATGVMGGWAAHEFTCLLDVGEDWVAQCPKCGVAANAELVPTGRCGACGAPVDVQRGVEVGNIFQLGTRYAECLDAYVLDRQGRRRALVMGSYGIGISRLLATLVEQHHDQRGIALPAEIAPFDVHLVTLTGDASRSEVDRRLYQKCCETGLEVLWDDRRHRAGKQFADADLIGAVLRLAVGRSAREGTVEVRERRTGQSHVVRISEAAVAIERLLQDIRRRDQRFRSGSRHGDVPGAAP